MAAAIAFGYNPPLVLGVGFHVWKRRQGQIQHAPGRFHSGAQVVKETEQAPPPLADAAWLRIRVHARSALPVSVQHEGNPQ
ncbi:MAG TPA: hypothetical protein VIN75_17955 [Burkholderiaceae bacterium]